MEDNYTIEHLFEVWNDKRGTHTEIGEDRDGLGLVEIRLCDERDGITNRIVFEPNEAWRVGDALKLVAYELLDKAKKEGKSL